MGRTRRNRADEELRAEYEKAAREALRNQTMEDIMEATPQATQRKITLASLDLVHAQRPDFQVFNELMILYRLPNIEEKQRVVPDNMVVLHRKDLAPPLEFRRARIVLGAVLGHGVRLPIEPTKGPNRQLRQVPTRVEGAVLSHHLPRTR